MINPLSDIEPDSVLLSRHLSEGETLFLTLNRPELANCFNEKMSTSLVAALGKAQSDDSVRVIAIGANGRYFCAGADIKEYQDLDSAIAAQNRRDNLYKVLVAILCCPKPVIAALQGPAIGGGLMLALACDEIIASDQAWVSMPEVKLGSPSPIGIELLREKADRNLVYRLIQLSERLNPGQAFEVHLFDRLVSSAGFSSEVLERVQSYAEIDSYAYMRNKSWINRSIIRSLEQSYLFASGRANT